MIFPISGPGGGIITSSTNEETIFPNAAPMIMPTAISITLPRTANSLNSLSTVFLLCFSLKATGGLVPLRLAGVPSLSADYIEEAKKYRGIVQKRPAEQELQGAAPRIASRGDSHLLRRWELAHDSASLVEELNGR